MIETDNKYDKRRDEAIERIGKAGGPFATRVQNSIFVAREAMDWQLDNIPPGIPTGHLMGQKDLELMQATNDLLRDNSERLHYTELKEFAEYVGFNPGLIDDFFRVKGKRIPG